MNRSQTAFESLENRTLMSTVTVANLNDSGAGSLRAAIAGAGYGDTINFGNLTGTITLQSTLNLDGKSLSIDGSGRSSLTIDASGVNQAITAATSGVISISDLKIKGAASAAAQQNSGAIYFNADQGEPGSLSLSNVDVVDSHAAHGSALYIDNGDITIDHCNFLDNEASYTGSVYGGAIYAGDGTLTISNSSFIGNVGNMTGTSDAVYGGALYAGSPTTLTNCTFYGNKTIAGQTSSSGYTYLDGSAIYSYSSLQMDHCTITNNSSDRGQIADGADYGEGSALYLYTQGASSIKNSIIAGNSNHENNDVYAYTTYALTFANNIIGDNTNTGTVPLPADGVDDNLVGTAQNPLDAKFGAVGYNGGDTQTVKLLLGSPAIDNGTNTSTTADQRGVAYNGTPDIGAYEYITPVVPTFSTTPHGTVSSNGKSATLSAAASVSSGTVSYSWRIAAKPAHAPNAVFANATSASTGVTFAKAGTYKLRVIATSSDGLSTMKNVIVNIAAIPTRLRILQHAQTLSSTEPTTMRAIIIDQFGAKMADQPTFTWSLLHGEGSIDAATGVYTPTSAKYSHLMFQATAGSLSGVAGNRLKAAVHA